MWRGWVKRVAVAVWLAGTLALGMAEPMLRSELREEVLAVPSTGFTEPELEVTVFMPSGPGPFPVVVINHGRSPGDPKFQARYRPLAAAREFVRRGYLVAVPMRQGFGRSGGREIPVGCNVYSNGEQQARSVMRTLAWLDTQPWADVSRNVVMGQSHGGLTTLAYGMRPHAGTRWLVNFAGGLRQTECAGWEGALIKAYRDYGAHTHLPSLWFYGTNDSYFPSWMVREAHHQYTAAGGRAELIDFGVFQSDAHAMFGSFDGLPIWTGRVFAAMALQSLPTRVVQEIVDPNDLPSPAKTAFATLGDVGRVPVKTEEAREGYRRWLKQASPRAFAIHPRTGAWGAAWGMDTPRQRAMAHCEKSGGSPCKFYAVDDTLVWAPLQ